MPSSLTLYRQRLKKENPQKYEEYLLKQKERAKARRAEKREKWANELHTRAMEEEREKQLELQRIRNRRYYEMKKKKDGATTRSSRSEPLSASTPRKRPKEMSKEELRLHNNRLRAESRARQSSQKKRRIREKDRIRKRQSRKTERDQVLALAPMLLDVSMPLLPAPPSPPSFQDPGSSQDSSQDPISQPEDINLPGPSNEPGDANSPDPSQVSSRLPKRLHNLTSIIKTKLSKKTNSLTYARVVKNLATPRTPEKRAAIKKLGFFPSPSSPKKTARRNLTEGEKIMEEKLKETEQNALYSKAQIFYTRMDVSRQLPHRRYATKKGAAYVMNITIKGAYRQFLDENPGCSIGYTKFSMLRPKTVKKLGSVPVDTCLCIYCLNIRYKVDALNRLLSRYGQGQPIHDENHILDLICCPKEHGSRWHKPECISGECEACKDSLKKIRQLCYTALRETISWTQWGRSQTKQYKLDVFSRKGLVTDLLTEMEGDIDRPTKQTSFRQHIHTAFWQYDQYRRLKFSLEEDEALLVMDFAENRKAMFNAEVKSAHFSKEMTTLHPVIAFYKNPRGQLVRHSLMFLSDDLGHDYHLVNHFTLAALDYLKKQVQLRRAIIFSDGCAAQYKGKGTFADLSLLSGLQVQRAYFGSEHGKGEADGETGVFSQMQTRAVQGGANLREAQDNFEWAQRTMTRTGLCARTFFLVKKDDVVRERPETHIKTVPGTRSYHQVQRVDDYIIKCRRLACFCSGCRMDMPECCINKQYVGTFIVHKLKESDPNVLDTAFTEDNTVDNDERQPQPEALPHPTNDATRDSPSPQPQSEASTEPAIPNATDTNSHSIQSEPKTNSAPSSSHAVADTPSLKPPTVGDFIKVVYRVGKKSTQDYICLVMEPDTTSPTLELEGDILVSYMKKNGAYYTLPEKQATYIINAADDNVLEVRTLFPPVIDNRGRHFF